MFGRRPDASLVRDAAAQHPHIHLTFSAKREMSDRGALLTIKRRFDSGSVGHDAGFHHLWERGTCSSFCVMGRVEAGPSGRRIVTLCWTCDERIEDGLYSYGYTSGVQERLEHPEMLLAPLSRLA